MTAAETRLVLNSDSAAVPDLQARLLDWCGEAGLDTSAAGELTTAVVEAVNNSIEHAYGNQPGHPISLRFIRNRDGISVEIRDKGLLPFPPPENPTMPYPFAEGGRGWAIINQFTDTVAYARETDENVLTLTRRL